MSSSTPLHRRNFVKGAAGLAGALLLPRIPTFAAKSDQWGDVLPTRTLGKTGLDVTVYCIGGHHIGDKSEQVAKASIDVCIQKGVRFIDTAESYQRGRSEELIGRFLEPKYREQVQLLTKTKSIDGESVRRDIKKSLERLRTDYIDIYLMHSVNTIEDADNRLERGVYEAMLEAKKEGTIRHLGFSGHVTPEANNHLINKELEGMSVMLCPVNVADPSYKSFILESIPLAQKHNIGVLAMKSLAGGGFLGGKSVWGRLAGQERPELVPKFLSVEEAHRFALSQPVASLVAGHDSIEQLEQNIAVAAASSMMSDSEREQLIQKVASVASQGMNEHYKG
ncbi:MAG: aldo/keto reductase [Cyanothece sp. SIO2G6]|nr:aldo/keto reductase [Cyanothece sp. SIO2G6]